MDTRSPALDTVKMQVYFDMNYTTRGILILLLRLAWVFCENILYSACYMIAHIKLSDTCIKLIQKLLQYIFRLN